MSYSQIDAGTQILPETITDAQVSPTAAIATDKLADGALFITSDGRVEMAAALNLNGYAIHNLLDGSAAEDAVNVSQLSGAIAGVMPLVHFTDQETPAGTIGSGNTAFILAQAPSPPASLLLFVNGLLVAQGADYTLSGTAVSFRVAPSSTDTLSAWYRY